MAGRRNRPPAEIPEHLKNVDQVGLVEAMLSHEGSMDDTYRRTYPYSMGNCALFLYQGVEPQPMATYDRWRKLGRQVIAGATAKWIYAPMSVKIPDEVDKDGNPKKRTIYVPKRGPFAHEDTVGEELPPVEIPEWSKERALETLGWTEVPFQSFDGSIQGYSYGTNISVSPIAKRPEKTWFHEAGHILSGDTTPGNHDEYVTHDDEREFRAETIAVLALRELHATHLMDWDVSVAYIQGHLRKKRPSDAVLRSLFRPVDQIVAAGRPVRELINTGSEPEGKKER